MDIERSCSIEKAPRFQVPTSMKLQAPTSIGTARYHLKTNIVHSAHKRKLEFPNSPRFKTISILQCLELCRVCVYNLKQYYTTRFLIYFKIIIFGHFNIKANFHKRKETCKK
jgi:hypothetical protein